MKAWFVFGCLLLILGVGGCVSGNVEDDQFFGRGWLNPREIDSFGETPVHRPKHPPGIRLDPIVD